MSMLHDSLELELELEMSDDDDSSSSESEDNTMGRESLEPELELALGRGITRVSALPLNTWDPRLNRSAQSQLTP